MSRNARWPAPASPMSWCVMTVRLPWRTISRGRPPSGTRPIFAAMTRTGPGCSASPMPSGRVISCTATCTAYQRDCNFGFGPVQITGLAGDGTLQNFAVLDVASMAWGLSRRGLLGRKALA